MALNLTNQLVTLFLSFISRTVFLQVLSVEYLGIGGLFGNIFTMLNMAELGIGTAMTYSMYKPLAEQDHRRLAGLVHFYRKVYRVLATIVGGGGILLIPFLKYLVHTDQEIPHLVLYYVLMLANTVASYLIVYKTCILTADQKGYIIQRNAVILGIIRTICMIIFLYVTHEYAIYLGVQVFFTYFTNFVNSYTAEKYYPFIKEKVVLAKNETVDIFQNIGGAFFYKLSNVLVGATDNTLISVIVNTAAVGYYDNYGMIITRLNNLINTFFYASAASIGNLVATEKEERRYRVFLVMESFCAITSCICVTCLYFLADDFIRVWLGPDFVLDRLSVIAMVINFYLSIIILPIWVFREGTGLYRETKYVMLMTGIVNIVVSILLGIRIGLAGILLATSIAKLSTYFWYEPKILFKKYFGLSCLVYFRDILRGILITGIAFAASYFIARPIPVTNYFTFFVKAIVVGMVSLSVAVIFYRKTAGFQMMKNRALGLFRSVIKRG